MIVNGDHLRLGARWDGEGVNFALFSEHAEAVDLCLFDTAGRETARLALPAYTGSVWHGYVPGLSPGQRYGFRAHGRYDPSAGLRFNPHKLLLDPYARAITGGFRWSHEVFGFSDSEPYDPAAISPSDSAPFVPKAVVTGTSPRAGSRARIPWEETIIYEVHPRGFTMRHPAVPAADRGRFRGLRNGEVLRYLKALGVTSIELMPIHAFVDEQFLVERGLRNYWGYNSIAFFAPEPRYLDGELDECRRMVDAIHDTGLEVILDVVYNHTAEGDELGPTLSFRGIDNASYYRLLPNNPSRYVNDTGCGNTINVDHPYVRRLIVDSLTYWATEIGVDGFRFDLGTTLGRRSDGFDGAHELFAEIGQAPALTSVKLIAEPWDVGPGGYQLGAFPRSWAEWNDRYRDGVRRFWRGDARRLGEFAHLYLGSAEIFESGGRGPWASINYVTSHDGFTLADVVSYERRHNAANREKNHDGHQHNYSCNYGIEGQSDDPKINSLRRRQRLNMLASVLLSQGTPMLLAGDELGNSQAGNNNAYPQDNEIGWTDWSGLKSDPEFLEQVRLLMQLRRSIPLLRQRRHLHGRRRNASGFRDINWLRADGKRLSDGDWDGAGAMTILLCETGRQTFKRDEIQAVAMILNATERPITFCLPRVAASAGWHIAFSSDERARPKLDTDQIALDAHSLACLLCTGLAAASG